MKLYTFWSARTNEVVYAIANSRVEAWNILKEKLINDEDTESYIIGTSINLNHGAYGSTSIIH